MNGAAVSRRIGSFGWLVALVLLHYSLRPFLAWRVQVDFLIIALLVVAVRTRPGVAAFCGFLIGVLTDALSPETFGVGALAMVVVGYASSWFKAVFFAENVLLNAFFVFAGKWVFDVLYVIGQNRLAAADLVGQLLWWSPISAIVTALVGLGVLAAERRQAPRHR